MASMYSQLDQAAEDMAVLSCNAAVAMKKAPKMDTDSTHDDVVDTKWREIIAAGTWSYPAAVAMIAITMWQ